jgi:hypothetical protein
MLASITIPVELCRLCVAIFTSAATRNCPSTSERVYHEYLTCHRDLLDWRATDCGDDFVEKSNRVLEVFQDPQIGRLNVLFTNQ